MEMNREYLENLAAKAELEQTGEVSEKEKRKVHTPRSVPSSRVLTSEQKQKTTANGKPRDASTHRGATAASSVRALLKHPRYSKRINHDALRSLCGHPARRAEGRHRRGPVDDGCGQV